MEVVEKKRRPDPETLDEYNRLQMAGAIVGGFGPETYMTVPCPFCGEPELATWYVWPGHPKNVFAVASKEMVCRNCDRGIRHLFAQSADGWATRYEVVQTRGDDPPAYLPPMRRDDAGRAADRKDQPQ